MVKFGVITSGIPVFSSGMPLEINVKFGVITSCFHWYISGITSGIPTISVVYHW